jgi:hypothetical protein
MLSKLKRKGQTKKQTIANAVQQDFIFQNRIINPLCQTDRYQFRLSRSVISREKYPNIQYLLIRTAICRGTTALIDVYAVPFIATIP